jgi:Transthyretin-like family
MMHRLTNVVCLAMLIGCLALFTVLHTNGGATAASAADRITPATDSIKGRVVCGGAPIARSTVTLWEASAGTPKQLDQTSSSDDGRFEVRGKGAHSDGVLYLVAAGGVPKASKAGTDK